MKENALSMVALAIRALLSKVTKPPGSHSQVEIIIGPPHEAAKQQEQPSESDKDYLCIFFYRMGYSGFPTDATSVDPLYLSAFCMITAFGGQSDKMTPGESELRLIGAIAEYFHRHPVLKLRNKGGLQPKIQIIPIQLTLDDINHLWATQNNTPYHLSLAYEFALLPVPLEDRVEHAPRTSVVSLEIQSTEALEPVEEEELDSVESNESDPTEEKGSRFFSVQVPLVEVDIKRSDWVPHICFLNNTGESTYVLTLESTPQQISLIVLGDSNDLETELSLEWEIWDPDNRSWKKGMAGGHCRPTSALLSKATAISITVPALGNKGQALLRATREFKLEGSAPRILASNPLLITQEDEP